VFIARDADSETFESFRALDGAPSSINSSTRAQLLRTFPREPRRDRTTGPPARAEAAAKPRGLGRRIAWPRDARLSGNGEQPRALAAAAESGADIFDRSRPVATVRASDEAQFSPVKTRDYRRTM